MRTATAFLVLLVGGCAAGPDYERPAAPAPGTFREIPAGWKEAEPRDEIARGRWWELFGDAELNALAERVESGNYSVAAAAARYRAAQAAVAISRSGLFPTVDADASVTRSRSPRGAIGGTTAGRHFTNFSAGVSASWEVDLWGRVRRDLEAAGAEAEASAADLAAARLSLQAELATSYFRLRLLDVQKRLLEDTAAAFARARELTENRYRAGVAARGDVVQADAQLKSAAAQALDLGVERAQLEHAIAILAGLPPSELTIAPRPDYTAALPPIPPGLPSALLERRPDVAAAERRVAAANARIGVAQSAYFPQLLLSASLGYRSSEAASWLSAPSRFWSLGPALAQSLFDAGLRRAQGEQALALYDATVADYRQVTLSAIAEVEDNLAALRILGEEAGLQEAAVRAAQESLRITLNQYRAGTVGFLDVVQVQTALLEEQRASANLLNRRLAATVALVRALGGGWQQAQP
ncbi:MAG TPA: efflux transporter outer membrane subunit [Burkholderiales bacterium]|nr:efflux transporter outer membrane subunit [Burkholderiales bacterium]